MAKKKATRSKKKLAYFYRDSSKRMLWRILIGACILSVVLELFLHRHSHFAESGLYAIDGMFGFYGALGFFGCIGLILIAKFFELFLKVKEDFYD
ncbi:MAG: hypothetical protein ACI9BD_000147 [Candidatus Marinamargulisbacteria bacterium]|jgi:hypothetical protein